MTPLAMTVSPANGSVAKGHPTEGDHDPPQGLPAAEEGGRVDSQSHEDITNAVDGEDVVDKAFFGGRGGRVPFEEGEGVVRAQDGVDAEAETSGRDGCSRDREGCGM